MTTPTDDELLTALEESGLVEIHLLTKGNGILSDDQWTGATLLPLVQRMCAVATHIKSGETHYGFAVWDETIQIEETTLGRCMARLLLGLHERKQANPNQDTPPASAYDYSQRGGDADGTTD